MQGTRQKTPAPMVRLRLACLMRWFPARHFIFVGDSGYGTSETARFGQKHRQHLTLVRTFSADAAWYEPPPPRHTMGRPRVQGPKLPSPHEVVAHTGNRTRLPGAWDGGTTRDIEVVTGTGHGYRIGADRVAVRWGYVPDGTGTQRDDYCLTTHITMQPQPIVARDTQRWSMATTFQEGREHLTLESTTSDGQQTVLRFTPG